MTLPAVGQTVAVLCDWYDGESVEEKMFSAEVLIAEGRRFCARVWLPDGDTELRVLDEGDEGWLWSAIRPFLPGYRETRPGR